LDARLYLERWLLTLKVAAGAAGLEAHVRALDFKGGERLALEVRKANEAIEIRYRKRRTGPQIVAAATGAEIVGRLREVHKRVLAEHRKLLENGLRRFLRKSIRMLEALESSLYRDAEFLPRTATVLRDVSGAAAARPAALVRRRRTAAGRYEIQPAAAIGQADQLRFVGFRDGRLVDLDEFMPKRKSAKDGTAALQARSRSSTTNEAITPLDAGTELLLVAADAIDSVVPRRTEIGPIAAGEPIASTEVATETTASSLEAIELTGAGEIMAEAMPAAGEIAAESVSAAGAAVEVVTSAGTASEALAETGSALADAACAGVDCGGIDCIPL
jgi:hypothetical protein